ncbi:hypothetical protein [Pseudomarimonas salicorniae]|uniref:RDD family protein n=1 Tax=Pseudomarimonas salicorniae TaxID=2933270 RepID=A0ABT0GHU6_9GAMM|nr:hypothetical protein [Lysobacter sp. CAU 1642]MCK7594127.1 hypothetical protein [Lysobacter sp. CAU 1642]
MSFERLRERTDELELIISGLSLFALVSMPGWLWSAYETYVPRMSLGIAAASAVLVPIASAMCLTMALLFVLHLAVRAHWVGLIGLKAVFPHGVRWERIGGIGRLTTARLRRRLPSLDQGIARADLVASTLFSLITFSAMALAVLGFWLLLLFLIAGMFGPALGGTNTFVNTAMGWFILFFFGAPLLRWLLDGVLLRWLPERMQVAPLRALVHLAAWVEGLFFPARLLGSIRLTLQSNLSPRLFFILFMAGVMGVTVLANISFQRARQFDALDSQRYVTGGDIAGGMRSAYYESQRIGRDALLPRPLIPDPVIETAWLPLFLPYVSLLDDPLLDRRCAPREEGAGPAFGFDPSDSDAEAIEREARRDAAARSAADCLSSIWEVSLDGRPQSLEGFMVTERADLGLRGLSGWLPLNGLTPGPHRLVIVWRPRPEQDELVEDYVPQRMRHVIPFLWSPEAAALPAEPPLP